MRTKRLYIKTYGCQMNVYDSQRMEESLIPLGFELTEQPESADLLILNTCHIRAKAEDKLFSDLGRLRLIKDHRYHQGQSTILVVAGCVGQALGASILKKAPYVDAVVGPQTYHTLSETVVQILRSFEEKHGHKPHLALGFPKMAKFDELPGDRQVKGPHAFLSIQEGCNKFCRYCVVPYTRGPEYSRPVKDVLEEAQRLIQAGARELTLLGQNVNAYHGKGPDGKAWTLGKLLYALAAFPSLYRLRYTTSHPRDVDDDLIAAHRDLPIVMPFLHLPVQSGSDRILAQMNRQYTASFYQQIIERFLQAVPHMGFSSDFIVGYPGETEEDFEATCALVDKVQFAQAFSFKYSPRQGTPAAMAQQVPEDIKNQRLSRLQEKLDVYRERYNASFVGKRVEVLIEAKKEKGFIGRSPFMQTVYVDHPSAELGERVWVTISHASPHRLIGEVDAESGSPVQRSSMPADEFSSHIHMNKAI